MQMDIFRKFFVQWGLSTFEKEIILEGAAAGWVEFMGLKDSWTRQRGQLRCFISKDLSELFCLTNHKEIYIEFI